jgi:hypothetical protein
MKVIDHPDLVREKESKAILNVDVKELNKYRQERNDRIKIKNMADEFDSVKKDLQIIKELLTKLIGQ